MPLDVAKLSDIERDAYEARLELAGEEHTTELYRCVEVWVDDLRAFGVPADCIERQIMGSVWGYVPLMGQPAERHVVITLVKAMVSQALEQSAYMYGNP